MKTMKKLILTLLMGAAVFGTTNANIVANISAEVGTTVSTSSHRNGLLLRGDSTGYFLDLSSDIGGGEVGFGFNMVDLHGGGNDFDFSFSYGRSFNILGEDLYTDFYYNEFDSQFGNWEEIGVATSYSTQWVDVAGGIWKQVGGSGQFGLKVVLSKGFQVINENLIITPYVESNFAEDFQSYVSGAKIDYDLGNDLSLNLGVSLKNNTADGGYNIDGKWGYAIGLKKKF